MKEKQATPFQVAPRMIEMDVQRNFHQIGGHVQSENHLKNMHQMSNLMHSVIVGDPTPAAPHGPPPPSVAPPPYAKPPPHASHPPYSAPPPSAAAPSRIASPEPLLLNPLNTPHVFHLLNSHQVLRHQPFQIYLAQILPIQTYILCKRTTFSLVLVENNTWCSMVGCTHMSRF